MGNVSESMAGEIHRSLDFYLATSGDRELTRVFISGGTAKGVTIASDYAKEMLDIENMAIVEGSGISRDNRVSALQMDKILQEFLPYHYLMRRQGREYYKTGTLYGVSTRAGYIKRSNGEFYRYVIIFNTAGKSTDSLILRLLRILD